MKSLISNTLAKWFKSLGFAGRFRFWCLYWAYRITGWHIRHKEWDFVLEYLPQLADWQKVSVLDVGASKTLFIYELKGRGYNTWGLDLNRFQEKICKFFIGDIRVFKVKNFFNFVTCISVLEHIEEGQDEALKNMIEALRVGGRLILTIPTHEFAQGHPWHGFNDWDLRKIFEKFKNEDKCTVNLLQYTETAGQMCMVFERVT